MPTRITGLRSTASGRNGSSARRSHHTKASESASESASSATIVGESHGTRVPPEVSASRNTVAPATISTAPMRSSRCGRSWRGSRFIER